MPLTMGWVFPHQSFIKTVTHRYTHGVDLCNLPVRLLSQVIAGGGELMSKLTVILKSCTASLTPRYHPTSHPTPVLSSMPDAW